jgi:hypothetical protein
MRGRQSTDGDGFIREVDEAVRQDRWLELWQHYGTYFVGAALAIVVGTAGGVGWRAYQANQRDQMAQRFAAAEQLLESDRAVEAAAAFGALADAEAGSGVGVLARLRAAAALGEAGDEAAKTAALAALAGDDDADPVYRELGDLLVIQQNLDGSDADALTDQLDALTASDAPWRHSALELTAVAQLEAGDLAAAKATLEALLADPETPPRLSQRAAELMAALGGGPGGAAPSSVGSSPDPSATGDAEAEAAK